MKNLMAKLKGLNFKEFALAHGEKFGFGLIAFLAFVAVYRSHYWGYPKTPEELEKEVKAARDQLRDSKFPEEKQKQFGSSPYIAKAQMLFAALPVDMFAYTLPNGSAQPQPMFWPVVPPIEQIKEPEFIAVSEVLTLFGRTIVAVQPPDPSADGAADTTLAKADEPTETVSEEDEEFAPSRPVASPKRGQQNVYGGDTEPEPAQRMRNGLGGKGSKGKKSKDAMRQPVLSSGDTDPGTGGMGFRRREKAEPVVHDQSRGVRFIAIRGVFDIRKQVERFAKANIPFPTSELVNFLNFNIERQRAVGGAEPWSGPWEPVDIKSAVKLLNETAGLEFDVVDPMLTDSVITMPLPERLTGKWTTYGSHPKIKEMTAEESERVKKETEELLKQYSALGEEKDPRAKGGFADQTLDLRVVSRRVGGAARAAGGMDSSYDGAAPQQPRAATPVRPAPRRNVTAAAGGRDSSYDGADAARSGGGRPGAGPAADSGLAGKLVLFRYLDFDVEPGEAYRYRVRLTLENPNFGRPLEEVVDASVVEGETRQTKWSEPSTPSLVPEDTKIFLSDVNRKEGMNFANAEVEVFQWDTKVGTMIHDNLLVPFGQFIGGFTSKNKQGLTWYLDPAIPSFQMEKVSFATRDMLVDTSFAPQLIVSEHPDLNLEPRNKTPIPRLEKVGVPDRAAVINRYGQFVTYDDAPGKAELSKERELVNRERKPFEEVQTNREGEEIGGMWGKLKGGRNPLMRRRRGRGGFGGGGGGNS